LDQVILDECHTPLDSTPEFRPKMQQLNELMEKGVQIVYLIIIILLYIEPEFINIIRIKANNVYIFRASTSRLNIAYSVVEYEEDEFGRGDIVIIYKLINDKLEKYSILIKIIIYNNNIVIIQKINNILDYYIYYRDINNITVKNKI
jgi:superfamily II DNA helicase RecQ